MSEVEIQFQVADDMFFATNGIDRTRWAIVCDTLAEML